MCGRFTLTSGTEEILEAFRIDEISFDHKARYNIAPSQTIGGVSEVGGKRVFEGYRWGLVPFWSKDLKIGYSMINARAETLQSKPAFRNLLTRNRIIIPSDGFYEWKREGNKKQPYRFQLRSRKAYAFAGLYDEWNSPEGEIIRSCTIITTTPNDLVKPVHDRMPVILDSSSVDKWLNSEVKDKEAILQLLVPYPASDMVAYPVSNKVGNVRNVGSELIQEISLNSE